MVYGLQESQIESPYLLTAEQQTLKYIKFKLLGIGKPNHNNWVSLLSLDRSKAVFCHFPVQCSH